MTTATIDPRIRARRIAVQRSAGQRRLRRLLLVLAVVGAAGLAFAATRTPLLDVDTVDVQGVSGLAAAAVVEASGIDRGAPMVDVDPDRAAAAVEALPGIADARVARSWPAGVRIEVTERVPSVAVPTADGAVALVDRDGTIVEVVAAAPDGVVALAGLTVAGDAGDTLPGSLERGVAVAGAATALGDDLAEVTVEGDVVLLHLADGGTAVVGQAGAPGTVVDAVAAVLTAVPPGCVGRIDVRAPSAPVLVRAEGC